MSINVKERIDFLCKSLFEDELPIDLNCNLKIGRVFITYLSKVLIAL